MNAPAHGTGDTESVEAPLREGLAREEAGDLEGAVARYAEAARRAPDDPRALGHLGLAQLKAGRALEATATLARLTAAAPGLADGHHCMGLALHTLGRRAEAEASFRRTLECKPDHVAALTALGRSLWERGETAEAARHLERAVALAPRAPEAGVTLALIREAEGRPEEAVGLLEAALRAAPNHVPAHIELARLHSGWGNYAEAASHYRRWAALEPDRAPPLAELGKTLTRLGEWEEAERVLERALALAPKNERALAARANLLVRRGDREGAWALVRPQVEGGRAGASTLAVFADLAPRMGRADEALRFIERRLAAADLGPLARRELHFRAGGLSDRAEEFDRAFAHFEAANAIGPRTGSRQAHTALVDALIRVFDRAAMAGLPRAGNAYRLSLFIVGMPRSGTTLAEQILASHPRLFGAGERAEVHRYVQRLHETLGVPTPYPACIADLDRATLDTLAERYHDTLRALAPDADVVTDKMPQNFLHLGLIALLLPAGRVVHMTRDPRDTCLSCYFQSFAGSHWYARDLGDLGFYYREYERLMAHWREVLPLPMLEVAYEDLVADQEAQSRRLVDFAGLEWDERCLRFHELERGVATASYDQVNRPMYGGSVGRWRHYERHLGPLLDALGAER